MKYEEMYGEGLNSFDILIRLARYAKSVNTSRVINCYIAM
jgi:hypothetical protein